MLWLGRIIARRTDRPKNRPFLREFGEIGDFHSQCLAHGIKRILNCRTVGRAGGKSGQWCGLLWHVDPRGERYEIIIREARNFIARKA